MKKESETKTIEEWLRTVDKPLARKEGSKKGKKPKTRKTNKSIRAAMAKTVG